MKYPIFIIIFFMLIRTPYYAQIKNSENLSPFINQIRENNDVTQILLMGDSHIQAGWFSAYLREQLQQKFGNAGRGLVFPYSVANSNGLPDIETASSTKWKSFRLVYDQDIFPQMGITGFVMGNEEPSLLTFKLKEADAFTKVIIFHDKQMAGDTFKILSTDKNLKNYIKKDKRVKSIQVQEGVTFPELAAESYTTTTRLHQLNKSNPYKVGQMYRTELTDIIYDSAFENEIDLVLKSKFENGITRVNLPSKNNHFILFTEGYNTHIFYGFQFLNNRNKGIVFNSVGVNGATYGDFSKYPLQLQQIASLNPDLIIIALGTNESLSKIDKETFKDNAKKLIAGVRKKNKNLPILLLSPTDNKRSPQELSLIRQWIEELSTEQNTAFFDLYKAMGGRGYFQEALNRREANRDGVHFLKTGYENQAQKVYQELMKLIDEK